MEGGSILAQSWEPYIYQKLGTKVNAVPVRQASSHLKVEGISLSTKGDPLMVTYTFMVICLGL